VPVFYDTCPDCGEKCRRIGTDIRPVFAQERLLLEVLLKQPMAFAGHSVWSTNSTTYWVDGTCKKISLTKARQQDPDEIAAVLNGYKGKNQKYVQEDFSNEHIQRFIYVNRYRLNAITDEAVGYIKNIAKDFDQSSIFCSFSGGKDSTVTSNLVMRALDTEKIIHIYGDTTLEYPTSADYIAEFRKRYPSTPLLVAKNRDQDFNNLCDVVGPPSRVLRWCCTVFKTGAITKKIEQVFHNQNRILSFQGIRRAESVSRSKYDRDSTNSKITKQIAASPIIDWLDFDVWLYILANELPFNEAYRQGFTRVGCWCCPNNSRWSEFLSSIYMADQYKKWHEQLYSFAKKVGKKDWKDYVDSGNWKARQGGNGLEYSKNAVVSFKPCALEENAYNFELNRPITADLYTLFKPFGKLNFELGNKRLNEVYVLSANDDTPLLKLSGRIGTTTLRITVINHTGPFKIEKVTEQLLNDQITKYQTCIACAYCQAVCRFDALKVVNEVPGDVSRKTVRYTIDENKCRHCLECVKHFDGGCYMKKVLRVKQG
jgi:phosphoadenosine phosphosulfate reductase